MTTTGTKGFQNYGFQTQSAGGFQMEITTPEPQPTQLATIRDLWDVDQWGNFHPGAGIRQVTPRGS